MVEVDLNRFPWTYTKEYKLSEDKKSKVFIGFRVRLDYLCVTNSQDPTKFDFFHFNSQADRLDNAQLAIDCGLTVSFGHHYILVTPKCYPDIYTQIFEYDNICVLPPST